MANTFKAIATVTVGSGGATNIQFANIPQTFDDLAIYVSGKSSRTQDNEASEPLQIRFNSSTSGYTGRDVRALVSSVYSESYTGETSLLIGTLTSNIGTDTNNAFSNQLIYIGNYKSSSNKSIFADGVLEANRSATTLTLNGGLWANSAAITSIELFPRYISPHPYATNFMQYSTATLYGIKNS